MTHFKKLFSAQNRTFPRETNVTEAFAPSTNRKTVHANLSDSNAICIERMRQQGECKMNVYSSSRLLLSDKNHSGCLQECPAEKRLYFNALKHASQFENSTGLRLLPSRICSDLTKEWVISPKFISYRTFVSGETFAGLPNLFSQMYIYEGKDLRTYKWIG